MEDELHFAFICPLYESERTALYRKVMGKCNNFMTLTNEEKLIELMKNHQNMFIKCIVHAWKTRSEKLYVNV